MWELLHTPLIETGFPSLRGYHWIYVPFNVAEALTWFGFAAFALLRYARRGQTWYELQYAASFVLFGFTDLIEVVATTPWLLGCTYALALLIGFGKRKGEESLLEHEHQEFGPTRRALRGYPPNLLSILTASSAALAGGTYIIYCLQRPDPVPFILSAAPAVTGLWAYVRLAWRSPVVETPELLVLRDPVLTGSVVAWVAMVALCGSWGSVVALFRP